MRGFALLLAAIVVLAVAGGGRAAEPVPPVAVVVGYFDSVALQVDRGLFGSEGTDPKPIERWQGTMRIFIDGPVSSALRRRLEWHVERFRLLSGIEVRYVDHRADANLNIRLAPSEEVVERSGSADTLCLTQYDPGSGAILWAEIYVPIPDGPSEWLDNCFAHELMHAVGFFAHPKDNDNRSILEQGAPYSLRTFTVLDAIGIRMLYDRRLRIGLSRERALPIVRRVAEETIAAWPRDGRTPEPGDPLRADSFRATEASPAATDRSPGAPVQ